MLFVSCTATKKTVNEQKAIDSIKLDFTNYLSLIENKDFETAVEYMLPDFFELVPKEQIVKAMVETFNNPKMAFEIYDSEILTVSDIEKVEEKFYSKLRYSSFMTIKVIRDYEPTEESKNLTKGLFETTFGADNVSYDGKKDKFVVYVEKDVVAISENGATLWKFLVIEEEQRSILKNFIPKEILDSI